VRFGELVEPRGRHTKTIADPDASKPFTGLEDRCASLKASPRLIPRNLAASSMLTNRVSRGGRVASDRTSLLPQQLAVRAGPLSDNDGEYL
jgi:hypothetical protein